ncbi:MAG: hypothetical protein GX219_01040 [Tissierellia bacterium]|nr:hypothetical protein [Tissierellia bacterium]
MEKFLREISISNRLGISHLKLGMNPDEVLSAIESILDDLSISREGMDIFSTRLPDDDFSTTKYMGKDYFFMVQFRDDKAIELAINDQLKEFADINILGKNAFDTSAEDLVDFLSRYSICKHNFEDFLLSTNYEFPEIGIRLWRDNAFHEKLLEDKEYVAEMGRMLEEEYRYLYFEVLAVGNYG